MQYLLSEEEYKELTQKEINIKNELKETLQDLCTRVANSEPSL